MTIPVNASPEDAQVAFSEGFEEKWLGVIGPSAWILLRKLARAGVMGRGVEEEILAGSIGIKPSHLRTTFRRLERFGMVRIDATGVTVTPRPVQDLVA